jgi:hypothetical protein
MPDPADPIPELSDQMLSSRPEAADAGSADGRFPSGFGPAHLDVGDFADTLKTDPLGLFDPHHSGGSDHANALSPLSAILSGSLDGSGGGITISGPLPDFHQAPQPIPPQTPVPVDSLPVPTPLQLTPPAILTEHHGELAPSSTFGHLPPLHLDPVSQAVPGAGAHPHALSPSMSPSILDPSTGHPSAASPHGTSHGHGDHGGAAAGSASQGTSQGHGDHGGAAAGSASQGTSHGHGDQGGAAAGSSPDTSAAQVGHGHNAAASTGGTGQENAGLQETHSAAATSSHDAPGGHPSATSHEFASASGPGTGGEAHDGGAAAAAQLGFG